VRSLALDRDAWTPPVLALFACVGNDRANDVWEARRREGINTPARAAAAAKQAVAKAAVSTKAAAEAKAAAAAVKAVVAEAIAAAAATAAEAEKAAAAAEDGATEADENVEGATNEEVEIAEEEEGEDKEEGEKEEEGEEEEEEEVTSLSSLFTGFEPEPPPPVAAHCTSIAEALDAITAKVGTVVQVEPGLILENASLERLKLLKHDHSLSRFAFNLKICFQLTPLWQVRAARTRARHCGDGCHGGMALPSTFHMFCHPRFVAVLSQKPHTRHPAKSDYIELKGKGLV